MDSKYPQKPGLDFILKQAFFYWNKTLVFQLMFSIMYFGIFLTVFFMCDLKYGIIGEFNEVGKYMQEGMKAYVEQLNKLVVTENYQNFSLWIMGTTIFLYPLNLGFFQIYRKMDAGDKPELSDLFAGYSGLNFFRYVSYYIFWYFIYRFTFPTIILAIAWVCITIFVAPMMFFMNKTIFESLSLSFKAMKVYFLEILVCVMVAVIFKYIGFALLFVGGLFTFPFWNAVIYSLYKTIFSEKA
jgi:hypothetical protein